jgi:hypothetical protein
MLFVLGGFVCGLRLGFSFFFFFTCNTLEYERLIIFCSLFFVFNLVFEDYYCIFDVNSWLLYPPGFLIFFFLFLLFFFFCFLYSMAWCVFVN